MGEKTDQNIKMKFVIHFAVIRSNWLIFAFTMHIIALIYT